MLSIYYILLTIDYGITSNKQLHRSGQQISRYTGFPAPPLPSNSITGDPAENPYAWDGSGLCILFIYCLFCPTLYNGFARFIISM